MEEVIIRIIELGDGQTTTRQKGGQLVTAPTQNAGFWVRKVRSPNVVLSSINACWLRGSHFG